MSELMLIIFCLGIFAFFMVGIHIANRSKENSDSEISKIPVPRSSTPPAPPLIDPLVNDKEIERLEVASRYEEWAAEHAAICQKKCDEAKNTAAEYRFIKSPEDYRYRVEHLASVTPFICEHHLICKNCKQSRDWCFINQHNVFMNHPRYPSNDKELENIKAAYHSDQPSIVYRPFGPIPASFSTAEEAAEALTRYLSTGEHSDIVEYRPDRG